MNRSESMYFALRCMLRPVLRFCLQYSLKIQDIYGVVKMELLRQARCELQAHNLPVNNSKLAVMTGLQRAEVVKLLREASNEQQPVEDSNIISKVIGLWQSRKVYLDEFGEPRALGVKGKESEFATLVQSVSKYLNPYTVLFELERLGYVHQENETVHLAAKVHLVADNFDESFAHLETDFADLLKAVVENISSENEPANLHLRTAFDNIPAKELTQIQDWLLDKGTEYHQEVSKYLAGFDLDANPERKGKGGARVAFTTFSVSDYDE